DAQILGANLNGADFQVQAIQTDGSRLSIVLRNPLELTNSGTQTLQDSGLIGLTLTLRVPDPTGLLFSNYKLRIASSEMLDSHFHDVYGYRLEYKQEVLLGSSSWMSLCKGPFGSSQRSVFYQGAQWHPFNGVRSDGENLVTATCESGAVATCMSWG